MYRDFKLLCVKRENRLERLTKDNVISRARKNMSF